MSVSTAAAAQTICAPLPVLGRDVTVPLVTGGEVTYAALDYAASAPALQRVWDDVAAYAPYYGSVHRGAGYLSQLSTDLFENARRTVAEFLDCRDDDQLVFTRSTTDSLNLLAAALPADCQVFVFETEHHASLLPWKDARVTYLNAPRTPRPGRRDPGARPRRPHRPSKGVRPGPGLRHRRLERHRRAVAGTRAGGRRARPRRPDRPGRRPARPAPPGVRPGPRRRLGRLLRPQAVRALRLRRPGRPRRLAPGRRPLPRGRRRQPQGHAARGRGSGRGVARERRPPRGRLAERHRRLLHRVGLQGPHRGRLRHAGRPRAAPDREGAGGPRRGPGGPRSSPSSATTPRASA